MIKNQVAKKILINYKGKKVKLDQHEFDYLYNRIFKFFGFDLEKDLPKDQYTRTYHLEKILTLTPEWNGWAETCEYEEILNNLCYHFTKLNVPAMCDSDAYKKKFFKKLSKKLDEIVDFIVD